MNQRINNLRTLLSTINEDLRSPDWSDKNIGIRTLAEVCVDIIMGYAPREDEALDPFADLEEAIYDRLTPHITAFRVTLLLDAFGPVAFILLWTKAMDQKDTLNEVRGIGPKTVAKLDDLSLFARDLSVQHADEMDLVGTRPTYETVTRDFEFPRYASKGQIIEAQVNSINRLKGNKVKLEQELRELKEEQANNRKEVTRLHNLRFSTSDSPEALEARADLLLVTARQLAISDRIGAIYDSFRRINPELARVFEGFQKDEDGNYDCVEDCEGDGHMVTFVRKEETPEGEEVRVPYRVYMHTTSDVDHIDLRDNLSAHFTTTGDTIGDQDMDSFDTSDLPEEVPFYATGKNISRAYTWKPQYKLFLTWLTQVEDANINLEMLRKQYKASPSDKLAAAGSAQADTLRAMWKQFWGQYHDAKNNIKNGGSSMEHTMVTRRLARLKRDLAGWETTRDELRTQYKHTYRASLEDECAMLLPRLVTRGTRVAALIKETELAIKAVKIPEVRKYEAIYQWMNSWQRAVITVALGRLMPEQREKPAYEYAPRRLEAWNSKRGDRLDVEWEAKVIACTPEADRPAALRS
tara:strand:- start:9371 stop:11110 length:1740 start_codon:yes stop_codon:yes gene_type:complete